MLKGKEKPKTSLAISISRENANMATSVTTPTQNASTVPGATAHQHTINMNQDPTQRQKD